MSEKALSRPRIRCIVNYRLILGNVDGSFSKRNLFDFQNRYPDLVTSPPDVSGIPAEYVQALNVLQQSLAHDVWRYKINEWGFPSMSETVLVVEDDLNDRAAVVRYLRRLQFIVIEAAEMEQALNLLDKHRVDLVILDIGLGKAAAFKGNGNANGQSGSSGYALLDIVRSRPSYLPVIVLTALDEMIYEVACLQHGADDFVLKHVKMEVLAARVKGCIRRVKMLREAHVPTLTAASEKLPTTNGNGSGKIDSLFEAGDLHIDVAQRMVQVRGGSYVHLSEREVRLLRLMAEAPGKVFRKHELLEILWGRDASQSYHSVDALVKSVRRKIEPKGGKAAYLMNARGLGYRLNPTGPQMD